MEAQKACAGFVKIMLDLTSRVILYIFEGLGLNEELPNLTCCNFDLDDEIVNQGRSPTSLAIVAFNYGLEIDWLSLTSLRGFR